MGLVFFFLFILDSKEVDGWWERAPYTKTLHEGRIAHANITIAQGIAILAETRGATGLVTVAKVSVMICIPYPTASWASPARVRR